MHAPSSIASTAPAVCPLTCEAELVPGLQHRARVVVRDEPVAAARMQHRLGSALLKRDVRGAAVQRHVLRLVALGLCKSGLHKKTLVSIQGDPES